MAKKKSDHAILQDFKNKNITLVRLNGSQVTINSEERNEADEKACWTLSLPEYPIEDFVMALAAMKTYVVNEFKVGSGAIREAFIKSLEIRSVTFKHNGGVTKAKVRVHKQFGDGLHTEFDMPERTMLIADSKGKFGPPPDDSHYGEDQTVKLQEVMKQAKLYLGGHRSQQAIPFPEEDPADDEAKAKEA